MIRNRLGKGETSKITKTATTYTALFVETGVIKAARRFIGRGESADDSDVWERCKFNGRENEHYVQGFSALCYALLVRIAIILSWLPYIAPFLLAAMIDAAISRKIKFETFGYSSPIKFAAAAHAR